MAQVMVPIPKTKGQRRPQAKVAKIGPKVPVWRRQLDWKGNPEKVDLNLFPNKIVCSRCGQPRYLDPRNAAIKEHPVTLCKPCSMREKNDRHNAMLRRRTAEKQAAALKAAKAACKALPKTQEKAPSVSQDRRSPAKGTPIAPKGSSKGKKAPGKARR